MDEAVRRYNELLDTIARRLEDNTLHPEQRQELKEIRAKLKILGPTVLVELEANERRLRALFDKHSY